MKKYSGSDNLLLGGVRHPTSLVGSLVQFKSKFNIDGIYFLWKLYLIEFMESVNQTVNFITVYVCTLPVEVTSVICALLAVEAFVRAFLLRVPNTTYYRNLQFSIDMVMDFVYVAMPIGILYFVYEVPVSAAELVQIVMLPSYCICSKLRTMLRQIIKYVRKRCASWEDRNRIVW